MEDLGEEEDQHDPEPEARKRHAEQRDRRAERVPDRAAPNRREDPERDGDGERQGERAEGELDRRAEAIADQRGDRVAGLERAPEIAAQGRAGPAEILQRDRAVEPQPLADLRGGLLRELAADQHRLGPAGSQPHDREQDDRDADEHQDGEADALEDVRSQSRLHGSARAGGGETADEVVESNTCRHNCRRARSATG